MGSSRSTRVRNGGGPRDGLSGAVAAFLAAALLMIAPPAAAADQTAKTSDSDQPTLVQALKKGDIGFSLNYRLEDVTDDAFVDDAHASTLRTTLSYRTARWEGLSAFVEFEDVSNLGMSDQHSSTVPLGIPDRPLIADPKGTELNQAYLRFTSKGSFEASLGRVQMSWGEERFLGAVPWRQNYQTYDGVEVAVTAIPRTTLRLAWIDNVNTVLRTNAGMSSPLLQAEIEIGGGRLTPYAYRLDYDDAALAALSTTTLGVRWQNTWDVPGPWSIPYHFEYAWQDETGDNPGPVDADYLRAEIGGKRGAWAVRLGYEVLGGKDGEGAFITPLATLHKWNGWADKFLATPADGLEDLYLAGSWSRDGWTAMLILHDFSADSGGADYGTEINALVSWKSPWKQAFSAKVALYDADTFAADTEKLWFWTSWSF